MSTRTLLVDPSGRGGIAHYTGMVAEALARAGAPPAALVPEGTTIPGADAVLDRLPFQEWGRPGSAGPEFYARRARQWTQWARAVRATARELRPDVIHFQAAFNRRLDGHLMRELARHWPVVWTAHDVVPFEGTPADARRFAAIYRSVDAVVVHSAAASEELRQLSLVEPFVLDHPVPLRLTDAGRDEARERLGLPAEGRIAAALGYVREYKGYDLLVRVWRELGEEAPLLLVMGDALGEQGEAVARELAALARVDARIEYVEAAQLELAAAAADVVLLPYAEASESGVLHLARAVGTPVIASDRPQLVTALEATGAGVALPREPRAWAEALTGPLPAPPRPPERGGVGEAHLDVYEAASRRNASRHVTHLGRPRGRRPRLVAYTDATVLGGAEESLATMLDGLDDRFEAIVMGTSPSVVDWIQSRRPSIEAVVVPPVAGKRDVPGELAHIEAVRRLRPDIFHANLRMPFACQYGIVGALAVPGVRLVVVEHSITQATSPVQRRAKRMTARLADAHVAVGERLARAVEREVGLAPGSIRTIHNGVPDRRPVPEPVELPRPLVGSVGRLSPEKGYDVLLEAVRAAEGFHLVLVGTGPLRSELEAQAEQLGVSERVTFTGWVPDSRAWIETYDMFVLPSRSEGLPLTVIEAMLAERAVVATDVGGVPELIEPGRTGAIVPSEDPKALGEAIARLAADRSERDRLGKAARANALERFSPDAMRSAYEALYDELLAPRSRGAA